MAGNTIGQIFTLTTFGESHGPALGAIVDGCPPGRNFSKDPQLIWIDVGQASPVPIKEERPDTNTFGL